MTFAEKNDKVITGLISGLLLPLLTGFFIYIFSHGQRNISEYLTRIEESKIITHAISLCVFPNLLIFLIFNHYDMLRALRGVLGITIFWAVIVFGIKLLI